MYIYDVCVCVCVCCVCMYHVIISVKCDLKDVTLFRLNKEEEHVLEGETKSERGREVGTEGGREQS